MRTVMSWIRRHAFPLVIGLALAGLFVYFAFLPRRVGLNLWADFVSGLSQATVLVGPIAAGACAVVASRWTAPLSARLATAARTPSLPIARHVVGTVLPVAASYPLALLCLTVYGAITGTYGAPSPAWLAAIGAATIIACAVGYFAGLFIGPRWFAAPAAAVGYFALYVLFQSAPWPYGIRTLFPAITNRDTEFARYITATTWGQVVLFLSISLILFLLVRPRAVQRERWLFMAAAPTLLVAIVAAGVIISTNGQYITGHNSRDFVCEGTAPVVCVNRGYAASLEGLLPRFEVLRVKTAGVALEPTLLEQNVEGVGDEPSQDARSIYIEGIDSAGLDQTVSRYVAKYGGFSTCSPDTPYDTIVATAIVDTWLSGFDQYGLGELDGSAVGAAEWARMKSTDPATGNTWLREHEKSYADCSLVLTDLP
ncbi:hypothetical protein ACFVR6_05925 [Microbacterium sp. NPDC058021]|uniref:hypothetical protein n=1 Tax=Microbacterium sp. NPDC058021 TaxID=3346306 RepID=UPI0036DE0732